MGVLEHLRLRTAAIAIDGQPSGTGVLVAEDLVLASAHVIGIRDWPPTASKSIATVFDVGHGPAERADVAEIVYESSPNMAESGGTTGEDWDAAPENLDFALLRLALPVPVFAARKTAGLASCPFRGCRELVTPRRVVVNTTYLRLTGPQ